MAYYSSPREYKKNNGKLFYKKVSCIYRIGNLRYIVKLGFGDKDLDKVRYGNWIYQKL